MFLTIMTVNLCRSEQCSTQICISYTTFHQHLLAFCQCLNQCSLPSISVYCISQPYQTSLTKMDILIYIRGENYKQIAPSAQDARTSTKVNFPLTSVTCYALIKTQVSPSAIDFKRKFYLKTEDTTWTQVFNNCVTTLSPPLKQVI